MAYEVNCVQEDGFMIRSEDEGEALEHIKQHAREKHDMDLSDDDARDMLTQT